jgi:hypothetical protein
MELGGLYENSTAVFKTVIIHVNSKDRNLCGGNCSYLITHIESDGITRTHMCYLDGARKVVTLKLRYLRSDRCKNGE